MINLDERATYIGKIIGNLQVLEFLLRLFLYEKVGPQNITYSLDEVAEGEWVPENPITNYDSLRTLVKKVNKQLEAQGVTDRVDHSLVDLRDAIAHGRVTAFHPEGPYKLMKYSPAKDGKVQVMIAKTLSSRWLKEQVTRTLSEARKVQQIGHSLGLSGFTSL
jgi:hypothetical protein